MSGKAVNVLQSFSSSSVSSVCVARYSKRSDIGHPADGIYCSRGFVEKLVIFNFLSSPLEHCQRFVERNWKSYCGKILNDRFVTDKSQKEKFH